MSYTDENAKVIDFWVQNGWEWGKMVSHEDYEKGEWKIYLTPNKIMKEEWLGEIKGKRILGLASGGGQQMPIFSKRGAICTVFDISEKQLESERMVSKREGYDINIVQGDMTKPLPFLNESFDIIFNPVSICYIENTEPLWKECYRILKVGGILATGFDNGLNYVFDEESETHIVSSLPYNSLLLDIIESKRKDYGYQFSHSVAEEISALLHSGFVLKDIYEDTNKDGNLKDKNIPTFYALRCIKE